MTHGKLAWSTPIGGLLWEFWGRYKRKMIWPGLAMVTGWLTVRYAADGAPLMLTPLLVAVVLLAFVSSFCALLIWLSYLEMDFRTLKFGFPHRLLLKPISTTKLALVPMLFGGAVVVAYLGIWDGLLLQPLAHSRAWEENPALNSPPWLEAVALSFFWWLLAVTWSTALRQTQPLLMLIVAAIHMLIWSLPQMPAAPPARERWLWLAVLMVLSLPAAVLGLRAARRGACEGPGGWSLYWSQVWTGRVRSARSRFGSAFEAQFWYEWRRFGLALPSVAASVYFVILPLVKLSMVWQGGNENFGILVANMIVCLPLLLAALMGNAIGAFDPARDAEGLPVFIAARPMTNGGFVLAKMVMALGTSVLTWLVAVGAAVFWVLVSGPVSVLAKIGVHSLYQVGGLGLAMLMLLVVLVLATWKYLLAGIGIALTGRRWAVIIMGLLRAAVGVGGVLVYMAAKTNAAFADWLAHWAAALLLLCLAGKLALAIAVFRCGRKLKVIGSGLIMGIAAGWGGCGLLVAGYTGLICRALHRTDLWPWIALAGFLVLPLADLGIGPLALRWNRHR